MTPPTSAGARTVWMPSMVLATAALCGCGGATVGVSPTASNASASASVGDPAAIDGTWSYRTEADCESSTGRGTVRWRWRPDRGDYEERGEVTWDGDGLRVTWWCDVSWDASARTLAGECANSLGDRVATLWQDGGTDAARELVLAWSQSNGCHGRGIATR